MLRQQQRTTSSSSKIRLRIRQHHHLLILLLLHTHPLLLLQRLVSLKEGLGGDELYRGGRFHAHRRLPGQGTVFLGPLQGGLRGQVMLPWHHVGVGVHHEVGGVLGRRGEIAIGHHPAGWRGRWPLEHVRWQHLLGEVPHHGGWSAEIGHGKGIVCTHGSGREGRVG